MDALSDEVLALVLERVGPPLAALAGARLVCRRWAGVGGSLLAVERRRAASIAASTMDQRTAHAAVTRALALDSRPALVRLLDTDLVREDDALDVASLIETIAVDRQWNAGRRGVGTERDHPQVGLRIGARYRMPTGRRGMALWRTSCAEERWDSQPLYARSLSLLAWAALYGATGCMDLLVGRGARLAEREVLTAIENVIYEYAWRHLDIVVGDCTSYYEQSIEYGIEATSHSGTLIFDPEPIVMRLLAAASSHDMSIPRRTHLTESVATDARVMRCATHPLIVLAYAAHNVLDAIERLKKGTHSSASGDDDCPDDDYAIYEGHDTPDASFPTTPERASGRILDSVGRVTAHLVKAGYGLDDTHAAGFTPLSRLADSIGHMDRPALSLAAIERMTVRALLDHMASRRPRDFGAVVERILSVAGSTGPHD
jgi:hypothetical protein